MGKCQGERKPKIDSKERIRRVEKSIWEELKHIEKFNRRGFHLDMTELIGYCTSLAMVARVLVPLS